MTIWIDEPYICESVLEPAGIKYESIEIEELGERGFVKIVVQDGLSLGKFDVDSLKRMMDSVGTGDPILDIKIENGKLVMEVVADKSVFREGVFE